MSTAQTQLPSNRFFGFFFAAVFLIAGAYLHFRHQGAYEKLAFAAAACFAILAAVAPKLLEPANCLWFKLGELMGRIVSPIVLGIIFFLIITPVGLLGRLFGRDPLLLKKRATDSYWIDRTPAGPEPESFKNQF